MNRRRIRELLRNGWMGLSLSVVSLVERFLQLDWVKFSCPGCAHIPLFQGVLRKLETYSKAFWGTGWHWQLNGFKPPNVHQLLQRR